MWGWKRIRCRKALRSCHVLAVLPTAVLFLWPEASMEVKPKAQTRRKKGGARSVAGSVSGLPCTCDFILGSFSELLTIVRLLLLNCMGNYLRVRRASQVLGSRFNARLWLLWFRVRVWASLVCVVLVLEHRTTLWSKFREGSHTPSST